MKLNISEKILHYRKRKNFTQEELASAIGVSAQAVSGWERDCGYPDITLLPGIARTLGISIDELMGNDDLGIQTDIEKFYRRFWEADEHEKLRMAIEYYRKYPTVYDLADTLVMVISDSSYGFYKDPDNMALLREASQRVIDNCTDNDIRCRIIRAMSRCADGGEAEKWLAMNPLHYGYVYGDVLEERLWNHGKNDAARKQYFVNNLNMMMHLIGRQAHPLGDPRVSISHNGYLRRLIRTFGENGEIPMGWMSKYAFITLRQAAALFGNGQDEEGFELFSEAIDSFKALFDIPDKTPLPLGDPGFFGDIAAVRHISSGGYDTYEDSAGNKVDVPNGFFFTHNPPALYSMLTDPTGWEWFNGVRNDPRFTAAVEWAKEKNDQWLEKTAGNDPS